MQGALPPSDRHFSPLAATQMSNPKAFQRAFEQIDKLRYNLERATRHINALSQRLQTESYRRKSLHRLAGQVGRTRKTFTKTCGHPISTLWRTLEVEPRTEPGDGAREGERDCDDGDAVMDMGGPSRPESGAQASSRQHHPPVDVDVIRKAMGDKRARRNARRDLSANKQPPTPEPQVVCPHEHQSDVAGQQHESFGCFGQQRLVERGCDDDLEEDPGRSEVGIVGNLLKPLGALTISKTEHASSFTSQ